MKSITSHEKAELAKNVGDDLLKEYGKRRYYTQQQVYRAMEKTHYSPDVVCWAYSLFLDHQTFDSYHESIGEACDYSAMKESMVSAVTDQQSDSWFDFDWDLSWLELPDIDLSGFFDFFDI